MFDKLIVCEPEGADIKNRRSYFLVSSLFVGVLFLAAVVFSIFAADYGLGNDSFELSMVIAPPEIAAVETQPQRHQPQPSQSNVREETPIRQVNMPRTNEIGPVPTEISTVPNTEPARPSSEFEIGPTNTKPGSGTEPGPPSAGPAVSQVPEIVVPNPEPESEPVKPDPPKPPPVKSGGVVNGIAKDLPTPAYPAIARQMNISGVVQVQVLINESGKVISANAVSGHAIFKPAAEKAAWGARFGTTTLSGVPVKVSGVILYNFKK